MHETVLNEQAVRLYRSVCIWIWRWSLVFNVTAMRPQCQPRVLFKYTINNDNCDSAYVECMYGMVSCWPWTNRKYVHIAVWLDLKVLLLRYWCSMQHEVVMFYAHVVMSKFTTWWLTFLRWFSCVECMYGTVTCWAWANRRCVCLLTLLHNVCLNLKVLLVAVWCIMRS